MKTPAVAARRFAAITLLLGALATVYVVVVLPLLGEFRRNEEAIAEAAEMLARFQSATVTQAGIEAQLDQLRQRQAQQGYTLTGSTDALAAVELQDRIKMVVRESGGVVRSVQTLPPEDEGSFRRIAVRLQMTTTTESLFNIVYSLETMLPLLFVDNVDVQSRPVRLSADQPATDPVLTVSLDLYGYRPPDEI